MKKPIPPKGDNPAALKKYNKELAAWKSQATEYQILKHNHDERYGIFGPINKTSYTGVEEYARNNFRLSTSGATKGQYVDIRNNNAVVTPEYKLQIDKDMSNYRKATELAQIRQNRERLYGTKTPILDLQIQGQKNYLSKLKDSNVPLKRLRRFFSKPTAEGGKEYDYNLGKKIAKEEKKLSDYQADRLKIQNPKAYNRWIAPSKSGMDLGGNFEDLQYDTTNHFNLGDKTVEQDINWYKTPTKDGTANVINPTKVEQSNAYEESSETNSNQETSVTSVSNTSEVKSESTKPKSVQQMLEGMKISKDRISGIQRTYGAQIAQSQKKGKNIQKLLKKLAGPITSLEMES